MASEAAEETEQQRRGPLSWRRALLLMLGDELGAVNVMRAKQMCVFVESVRSEEGKEREPEGMAIRGNIMSCVLMYEAGRGEVVFAILVLSMKIRVLSMSKDLDREFWMLDRSRCITVSQNSVLRTNVL